jgi:putative ABC transport system ATP-binding protein
MSTQSSPLKANKNAAIVCRNIHKTYGIGDNQVQALRGVDLCINQGELKLLMGPSGSGKTTLISIISGFMTPDSGECWVKGVNLNLLSETDMTRFRRQNIGFVFQDFNLVTMLTVEENVSIPLLIGGIQRTDALEQAKQFLVDLELADKIGKHPNELSAGQQQRVAIARAIINAPHFIVCDEPTSFLDHHTGMKIMEYLQSLAQTNKITVVVVTHDPRIVPFADTIDHLEDGKIIDPHN